MNKYLEKPLNNFLVGIAKGFLKILPEEVSGGNPTAIPGRTQRTIPSENREKSFVYFFEGILGCIHIKGSL